jgi:hypothetical protein
MNATRKIMLAVVLGIMLPGCKNVNITTETTEKAFDKESKVVSEKTTKTQQKDTSFTFGFSEGDNKQINIVPLDISVVK